MQQLLDGDSGRGQEKRNEKCSKQEVNFPWRNMNPAVVDTKWKGCLPDPPQKIDSPLAYFCQFFTNDMMQMIVAETNKYATQCGASFCTTLQATERYIGILIRMGVVQMPRYRTYWSSELRYNAVADFMSRKEFEDHGRYVHFSDNTNLIGNRKDAGYHPLFKIRPLLESLRKQCLLVAPEQRQSVDEQIIPFKGKNRLRRYLPKKPKRWGFKVLARRCAHTRFTHDFTLHRGSTSIVVEFQPADLISYCARLPQRM